MFHFSKNKHIPKKEKHHLFFSINITVPHFFSTHKMIFLADQEANYNCQEGDYKQEKDVFMTGIEWTLEGPKPRFKMDTAFNNNTEHFAAQEVQYVKPKRGEEEQKYKEFLKICSNYIKSREDTITLDYGKFCHPMGIVQVSEESVNSKFVFELIEVVDLKGRHCFSVKFSANKYDKILTIKPIKLSQSDKVEVNVFCIPTGFEIRQIRNMIHNEKQTSSYDAFLSNFIKYELFTLHYDTHYSYCKKLFDMSQNAMNHVNEYGSFLIIHPIHIVMIRDFINMHCVSIEYDIDYGEVMKGASFYKRRACVYANAKKVTGNHFLTSQAILYLYAYKIRHPYFNRKKLLKELLNPITLQLGKLFIFRNGYENEYISVDTAENLLVMLLYLVDDLEFNVPVVHRVDPLHRHIDAFSNHKAFYLSQCRFFALRPSYNDLLLHGGVVFKPTKNKTKVIESTRLFRKDFTDSVDPNNDLNARKTFLHTLELFNPEYMILDKGSKSHFYEMKRDDRTYTRVKIYLKTFIIYVPEENYKRISFVKSNDQ